MGMLESVISAIQTATGITPTAFNSRKINTLPAINYQCYRSNDNGATAQWRLETRVVASTYSAAIEKEELMKSSLVSLGNTDKIDGCYIYINGGGTLEDEDTGLPILITYYDIIKRS